MKKKTDEELIKDALNYTTRSAFRRGSPGSYQAVCKKGKPFLDKLCAHMEPSKSEAYSDEEIRAEASKHEKRNRFYKNAPAFYHAAWRKGKAFLDSVCSHMIKRTPKPKTTSRSYIRWTDEMIFAEARKHETLQKFKINSSAAHSVAKKRGLIPEIKKHMVGGNIRWNRELLQVEANKFSTLGEFQKKHPVAYTVSLRKGILYQICSHMPPATNEKYTIEEIKLEAAGHKTRSSFKNYNTSAYSAALRMGILDEVCINMKPAKGPSLAEMELFVVIKEIYPQTKKMMDRRVSIPGKPHIHGFEIDILVGDLGIEYDGKRYHSYEYMRNDPKKAKWSDEDIRNYHKLKDDWFATKGIEILHIKEEDWLEDKQACILRCLEFLAQKH